MGDPEIRLENMVEEVKNQIETRGFRQLVTGVTRTWEGQRDSTLDQIWTNCGNRIINHFNLKRPPSDHNIIGANISLSDIKIGGQNIVRRKWSKFDTNRFKMKCNNTDWSSILREPNPELANSIFEEKLNRILDSEAPMGLIQRRTRYLNWLSDSTKDKMEERDKAKDKARDTKMESDWIIYRKQRNECTRLQNRDRTEHLRKTYERIELENYSSRLFSLTKNLLGWSGGGGFSNFIPVGGEYCQLTSGIS